MYIREIILFLQQNVVLSIIWFCLLIAILYTTIKSWLFKASEISCHKAVLLINKKDAIVIDIRRKQDYHTGYIRNSINVSVEDIKNDNIFPLKRFKKNPLIIAHNNSILAHLVKKYLCRLKFEEVYVLHDGIMGWEHSNFPLFFDTHKTLK